MLVLSRRKSEAIIVGDNIEIVLVDIRSDKVRIGINAPKEVGVHRQEIWEKIDPAEANHRASGLAKLTPEERVALGIDE